MAVSGNDFPTTVEGCVKPFVEDMFDLFTNEAKWDVARRYLSHTYNLGLLARDKKEDKIQDSQEIQDLLGPTRGKKPFVGKTAGKISDLVKKPWPHAERRKRERRKR